MPPKPQSQPNRRWGLRQIAETTLEKIATGAYVLNDVSHDLSTSVQNLERHTAFYAADSELSTWASASIPAGSNSPTRISLLQGSTIEGTRHLWNSHNSNSINQAKIGVLNFASAKNPGGGFLKGAQAQVVFSVLDRPLSYAKYLQEESLARSSTLYASLMTNAGQQFYSSHKRDPKNGYYSHAMIYSPRVVFFRNDAGEWTEPMKVDLIVSAAVNAGVARRHLSNGDESPIALAMKERMARILFLFETKGMRHLVLGSFGTGVFQNRVDVVASLWADLLAVDGARFKQSFDSVVFAVLDEKTFVVFEETLKRRTRDGGGSTIMY